MIALYFTLRIIGAVATVAAIIAIFILAVSVGAAVLVCGTIYLVGRGILRGAGVIK